MPEAKTPTKSRFEDAGWDLYATKDIVVIKPEVIKIPTGIAVSIPRGYVGLIWDRSGMGSKGFKVHGGVVDSGYTGEIFVCLSRIALPTYPQHPITEINKGDKIAQLVIQEVPLHVTWEEVSELEETDRGDKGFGSSG